MNYERIQLLLSVFHDSLDVPNTDKIRAEIMKELRAWNSPQGLPAAVEDVPADPEELELKVEGRRL